MLRVLSAICLLSLPASAQTGVADLVAEPGWQVHVTNYDYDTLLERTLAAVPEHGMAVVTQAGPTGAAARRGIEIPGNRVIGIFNNDFAVRLLRLSTEAMIHAPIRLYVTENSDGTATLSYIQPSELLSLYSDRSDPALRDVASELDVIFAAIAASAIAR